MKNSKFSISSRKLEACNTQNSAISYKAQSLPLGAFVL